MQGVIKLFQYPYTVLSYALQTQLPSNLLACGDINLFVHLNCQVIIILKFSVYILTWNFKLLLCKNYSFDFFEIYRI